MKEHNQLNEMVWYAKNQREGIARMCVNQAAASSTGPAGPEPVSASATAGNDRLFPVTCDGKRAMIVDDEKLVRQVFQAIMAHELPDLEVDMAGNGAEAVDMFSLGHHALLLMDVDMPVLSGDLAFCEIRKLCSDRNWVMPSVVFCTGQGAPEPLAELLAKNPRHCLLLKPVDVGTLVATVKSHLP